MTEWTPDERRRADGSVERLLASRDSLSRTEKEQVFESVLGNLGLASAPSGETVGWWWAAVLPSLAVAALFWGALLVPTGPANEFTPRGAGERDGQFSVYCSRSKVRAACREGTDLVFAVPGGVSGRYFSAFSRGPDGTVVWYFPSSQEGESYDTQLAIRGVLTESARLGAEHPPGMYEMYGVFSGEPMVRDEVRKLFEAEPTRFVRVHLSVE